MQAASPMDIRIDPATRQAFLETHYRVLDDASLVLRIDERSEALAALHQRHGVECSAFITACNPYCRELGDDENARRHTALQRDLTRLGYAHLEGIGQHPDNDWPGEPSWLVLGIQAQSARELGMAHEQAAILWAGADAVPRLIELVPVAPATGSSDGEQDPGADLPSTHP